MNKKKLSLVMAGAMLASSVAPVLAAEVTKTEVSADNLGLLIRDLKEKLNSKKFADEEINGDFAGKSLYDLRVDNVSLGLDVDSTQAEFQAAAEKLTAGKVLEVYTKDHVEKDGKYYAFEYKTPVYTNDEIESLASDLYKNPTNKGTVEPEDNYVNILVDPTDVVLKDGKLTIEFKNSDIDNSPLKGKTITLTKGMEKIDFTHYIDTDHDEPQKVSAAIVAAKFVNFPKVAKQNIEVETGSAKVEEITITSGGNNFSVEDIYDGLMLTTKGHDFFKAIEEAERLRGKERKLYGNVADTEITEAAGNLSDMIVKVDGKYSFIVKVPTGKGVAEAVFTVTGTNEAEVERLAKWVLAGQAKVDILAGSNRYATAVTIAEEYAGLTTAVNGDATTGKANIVLVNGNSLVDGLAASPLAAALKNGTKAAPVLLTESDRLPKETRAYLKKVIGDLAINNVKGATIHIVGGEAVVSKDLERELKGLGFSVERYGGDNREETSLEVADKILELQGTETTDRFVVGANGEADAMSIAAVASNKTADSQTPIIVAKNGGISEDALYELRGTNVTIIGGEAAISKAEEEEMALEAKSVSRIAGANRQETNAKIIEKYYTKSFGKAQNVVVAKDGQHKKSELVDALAAANFASEKQAPIVLATNKLSDAQINALELNAGATAEALYQVGIGVDKDNVVKVIAQRLGLAN